MDQARPAPREAARSPNLRASRIPMNVLMLGEHDGQGLRLGSRSTVTFASAVAEQTGGSTECLLIGHELATAVQDAAAYAPVLVADDPALANPVADRYAKVIADVVEERGFDL